MQKWYLSDHLYKRWVEHNQAVVDSLSGGKIGYVHVEGMDGSSYQTVYDQLLGKYRNCDAVIVDTRSPTAAAGSTMTSRCFLAARNT